MWSCIIVLFIRCFLSSRRRHTRCALVTGVQTCALPICCPTGINVKPVQEDENLRDQLTASRSRPSGSRSEEHTSELQSLMRNSYAVFCLKKKKKQRQKVKDRNYLLKSQTQTNVTLIKTTHH